jgi:flagellar hook-associated protein 2
MSFTPLAFTGVSQFSNDFQSIMERAVKIAQLPIQAMQNRGVDTLQKKALLGGVSAATSDLATSLETLGKTANSRALRASSSKTSVVTATAGAATSAASYTINSVTSVATSASERTNVALANSNAAAVGTTGSFQLKVGTATHNFTATNNTLVGVRDAINGLGAGVTASILTTSGGNYLSVSANSSGAQAVELRDDPTGANTNLLTNTNQGSDLVFHLNGIEVRQSRNLVNAVIPGMSFTVHEASSTAVELALKTDRSDLSSALQSFASNFNRLRTTLNAQVGSAAGLLTGNPMLGQISGVMRQVAGHRAASGSVRSLADVGLSFDNKGAISFKQETIDGMTDEQLTDAFAMLNDSTTGLARLTSGFRQFSEPVTGLIAMEQEGLNRVDQQLQRQIAVLTERIEVMQRGMTLRLQKADSLLAGLESQQNTVKASLQGLNVVLYGKQS